MRATLGNQLRLTPVIASVIARREAPWQSRGHQQLRSGSAPLACHAASGSQ